MAGVARNDGHPWLIWMPEYVMTAAHSDEGEAKLADKRHYVGEANVEHVTCLDSALKAIGAHLSTVFGSPPLS